MKWFWKWLRSKLTNIDDENEIVVREKFGSAIVNAIGRSVESSKSISFTMLFAEGGVVLQQSHYDNKTDRSHQKLYLIPEDQDVAQRVGEIVAVEMYRV